MGQSNKQWNHLTYLFTCSGRGHIINGILHQACWGSSGDSGPGSQERPEEGYPHDPWGILCLLELAAVTSKIIGLQWIISRSPSHPTQGSHYS